MGRRKIEIRAIKDDRNRSVTFLKRKGGLFKKAHELSVLCSVDVAVIIFGHNKKLYEFSSGDINETLRRYQYYGPPHEHKGPGDFKNKGGDDDDDDDDEDEPMHRDDSIPPQHHMMPQQIPQHNSFQHVRAPGQSASPPMVNGMFPQRNGTPQPSHMGSRPSSRNTVRRTSSNLVPMQHPHPSPAPSQNGFAYTPNPPIYQPQPNGAPQPSPQPSQYSFQSHTPQPQHQSPYLHQEPQHQPPTQAPPRDNTLHPPSNPVPRTSPQPQQGEFRQPEQNMTPPQIKHLSSNQKSRSIFTPIDEGGSVLAQHFFGAPDPPRTQHAIKRESPGDIKPPLRTAPIMTTSRPSPPPRPASGGSFRPPTRSDTNGSKSGARPKLNLTIPSENSEDEASTSPNVRSAVNSANPVNGQHHGIVLPPPSPSASAVLSAGATGPPNPFARPPPPTSNANQGLGVTTQNSGAFNDNKNTNNNNNNNNNLETPISALPSRYMDRDLLASPGGIFGAWGDFGGGILPSPNVNTPAERGAPNGWSRSDASDEQKRKGDELQPEGKRVKT